MNRSLGKRNLYPFFSESLKNAMAKLMLDVILIHELPHLAYKGKI
jgi:hypothetical protein